MKERGALSPTFPEKQTYVRAHFEMHKKTARKRDDIRPPFSSAVPFSMASSPLLLLLLLLPSFLTFGAPDLAGDAAALLAFRASVGRSVLQWNPTASPSSWRGVYCSGHRVTAVRLPAVGLRGVIPAGTIGNLTALRVLSLRLNALSGSLPPDISNLHNLRNLYLHGNHFSGELPGDLFSLSSLSELDLAENNFSGEVSPLFNSLTRLRSLFLQNNQLSGELPNINLPDLIEFNVSYNKLEGSVPPGLRSMPATSFLGTPLCDGPLLPCATENPPSPRPSNRPAPIGTPPSSGAGSGGGKKSHKLPRGAVAVISVFSTVGILFLAELLIICYRRSKCQFRTRSPGSGAAAAPVKTPSQAGGNGEAMYAYFGERDEKFVLDNFFNESMCWLGSGPRGPTHRVVMKNGNTVVVKHLADVSLDEYSFFARMQATSWVNHKNVLRLRASHMSGNYRAAIYDYMPLGSLSSLLHEVDSPGLDWNKRCSVALAAARGIQFIQAGIFINSHGNIKSSNIFLCDSNDACVSEHGLNQLSSHPLPANVDVYRAPEVTDSRNVSQSADVYSFGVVLLELLTGKAPFERGAAFDLARWMGSMAPEDRMKLLDPQLMKDKNVHEESMERVMNLAMDCAVPLGQRPSIHAVVVRLEQIVASMRQRQPPGEIKHADD